MYGFPKDFDSRKPDRVLEMAMKSSEVFEKGESLLHGSLNPSLIYFDEAVQPELVA